MSTDSGDRMHATLHAPRAPHPPRTGYVRMRGLEKSANHCVSMTVHCPVMRSRMAKASTPATMSMSIASVAAARSPVPLSSTSWRVLSCTDSWSL